MHNLKDKQLYMYTDGSYSNEVGAAAAIILFDNNPEALTKTYKHVSQSFHNVSILQMELMAVYVGLVAIHEKCANLTIFTDQINLAAQIAGTVRVKRHKFIIEQIRKELANKAEHFKIRYRQSGCGNKFGNLVHNLAKKTRLNIAPFRRLQNVD